MAYLVQRVSSKFTGCAAVCVLIAARVQHVLIAKQFVSASVVVAVSSNEAADAPHDDPGRKDETEEAVDAVKQRRRACW